VTSAPFENFILLLIILNTLLLMLKFEGAPLYFMDILIYFNLIFTLLFTIECVLKLSSFGPKVNGTGHIAAQYSTVQYRTVNISVQFSTVQYCN